MKKLITALILILGMSGPAQGLTILLSDNFDSENGGVGQLNYSPFANWNISNGSVDIIGNHFFDLLPGNGLYIDLDGSSNDAGKMTSKTTFGLNPGEYQLQFNLAGSQRGDGVNAMRVSLGGIYSELFSLGSSAPFATITRNISVILATTGELVFDHQGGDNQGLLLDEVKLTELYELPVSVLSVPEPSAFFLVFAGLLGMIGLSRVHKL